jgi:beta-aspartyl-peptidase (threonine type)
MKKNTITMLAMVTLMSSLFNASISSAQTIPATPNASSKPFTLVIHGGAGTISPKNITPEIEAQYRASLDRALKAGYAILEKGGTSTDAVVAAIKIMEDDPLFNAGKGAVFTNDGKNELDASIMDGKTGLAGAVAGVTTIKNPITAARAVMDKTKHVMLIGPGAEKFAATQNLELVDPSYFFTQHRWDGLQRAKAKDKIELDHSDKAPTKDGKGTKDKKGDSKAKLSAKIDEGVPFWQTDYKYGTVGAVALDQHGNLAAGTSTGGLTNKMYGRVGDAPIIGAGTYADNQGAAISCTGTGEFFIRGAVAYDINARMKYGKANLFEAVDATIKNALDAKQGDGGLIALDAKGNIKFGFNTDGMYRGYIKSDGKAVTHIFKD